MYFSSYGSLSPQANEYFLACTIVPEDVSVVCIKMTPYLINEDSVFLYIFSAV